MPYVDHTVVGNIFRSLRGRFGNAFVDKFRSGQIVPLGQHNAGKDTGLLEAMDVWVYELRQLSAKDIEHGLSCKFKYPPSADEFVQACCTREITPPTPTGDQKALPAPKLTREEAEKHLSKIGGVVKRVNSGNDRLRLENWLAIADETERGVYPKAASFCQAMAAEVLFKHGHKLGPEMLKHLPAKYRDEETNPMEAA